MRRLATTLIHGDEMARANQASVVPMISPSVTYRAKDDAEFARVATAVRSPEFYTRYGNPTHAHAEQLIASAEGTEAALLFSSGMAAMSTAILTFASAGDHIVLQRSHYGGTAHLVADVLPRFGITSTCVDQTDSGSFAAAMTASTKLIIAESPSNPILAVTDLAAVVSIARARNARMIVDNTFATPVNQRPAALGAHLIMHSATKALGGHADLLAGALAGSASDIRQVWELSSALGCSLGAFDSWLLARGLRTLTLRVERQNASTLRIAQFLESHGSVAQVNYPGLESHPQHILARAQMSGFGGVVSFRVRAGLHAAQQVIGKLRLFSIAASLGGYESKAVRPAAMLAKELTEEEFAERGVTADLIRLSIGLEDPADLIADLSAALD